jgi:hypothetical protein
MPIVSTDKTFVIGFCAFDVTNGDWLDWFKDGRCEVGDKDVGWNDGSPILEHSKSSGGILLLLHTFSLMKFHEYDTRETTPGNISAQLTPHEDTPTWVSLLAFSPRTINGPPESRWQESFPGVNVHIILGVLVGWGGRCSWFFVVVWFWILDDDVS